MLRKMVPAGLCALAAWTALPAHAQDPDWLRKQTVQIKVTREDAPDDYGSGVLLCQQDDLAYILTAHHVLYGKKRESRRDVKTTEISFFSGLAPRIVEDRDKGEGLLTPYPVKDKDLALIVVEVLPQLPAVADLGRPPAGGELIHQNDHPVRSVGYAQRSGQGSWIERNGALLRRDADFLYHSIQIEEGFSGGPLFNEAGALIGINVQFVSRTMGGDDSVGNREGRAIPIDVVRAAVGKWVPAACLTAAGEDENTEAKAYEIYKKAMREISIKRWKAAEPLLREAIEQKPLEGGSLHLQGMRYTVYLPHYHLGLALYRQGRYREAYRELAVSDVQGAIHDDKRHRRLKKYLETSREKRKEEAAAK